MTVQLRQNAETLVRRAATPVMPAMTGGLARGTIVLTARGGVAVEDLRIGDRIITRERGTTALRGIVRAIAPVCVIRPDSLGRARPDRDTTIAADQHVALRDWRAAALFATPAALVPARRLTDGRQIALSGEAEVFRLDLGAPLTIYANGLEAATGRTEESVVEFAAGA